VAAGLEDFSRLKGLGIPEGNIVQGWRYPDRSTAKAAAVTRARSLFVRFSKVVVLELRTARTVQEWRARVYELLPHEWLRANPIQLNDETAFILDQEV